MLAAAGAVPPSGRRWVIAGAGTFLHVCLGTVYAWSFFQKPVVAAFGCTHSEAAWAFSLAICFLGLAAAWGGRRLAALGPARLAITGGLLYASGYLLAGLALHLGWLWLFHLGFGVVGGCGLGLGYVTPVATAVRWFPDRKGAVTGMVVMGFGLGAMVMSLLLGPWLLHCWQGNLAAVFASTGLVMLAGTLPAAACLRNPPPGAPSPADSPDGQPPSAPGTADPASRLADRASRRRFAVVWLMFFCNIVAGILFIGFQSPMLQELMRAKQPTAEAAALAAAGAGLIALSSVFNGLGRLLWGAVSDRIGRIPVFRLILGSQLVVFALLGSVEQPWLFGALVCYVLLCYGGGFGTIPALVTDLFGSRQMAAVYGPMLTAWSAAGIAGPQLAAILKDHCGPDAAKWTFGIAAIVLACGWGASWWLPATPGKTPI